MNVRRSIHLITAFLVMAALFTAVVSCGGAESQIIGKWQFVDSAETIEFFSDGTVMTGGSLPMGGSYDFVDQNRIRIQFGGLGALAGPQIFGVQISGNRLALVPEYDPSGVWELVRVKK